MALPSSYKVGTVTVSANSAVVTGVGTNWTGAGLREGDIFAARGLSVSIASVDSATQITLSEPWQGTALTAQPYEVRYVGDTVRVLASSQEVLRKLIEGDIIELGDVQLSTGAAGSEVQYTSGVLSIPRGDRGLQGLTGDPGAPGPAGAVSFAQLTVVTGAPGTDVDISNNVLTIPRGADGEVTSAFIDGILPVVSPQNVTIPLFSDAVGKVPVWLSEGALDAAGMAPNLRDLAVQDIVRKVPQSSPLVPLIGAGGKVVMWVDADGLQIHGYQKSTDGEVISEPKVTVSDGASLSRVRWKLAQMQSGIAGAKLKIAGIGDSWWEMVQIPRAFRSTLDAEIGLSGEGFRPASSGNTIGPAAWSSLGWTISDGSASGFDPEYGAGPDGTSVWTNGTAATMSLTNVVATEIRIYSYQHGGTWRYRIDGGAWTTVAEDNTGAFRTTSITSLSDAAHALEIDTSSNAGIVSMAGIYSTRNAIGAEVLKFGNGGTTGLRVSEYAEYLTAPMADIQPDVAVIILGTNDYRTAGASPQTYTAALDAIVAACRAAVSDIGFVICVPPQTSGTAVVPLSQYRDAAKLWCAERGHEYISYLDRWSDYPTANAHGLYLDALHVNDLGASVLVSDLLKNLILKDS